MWDRRPSPRAPATTDEDELTRLLAGTAAARAEAQDEIRALAARVDLGRWETCLRHHRLVALCGMRLSEYAPLPDPLAAAVQHAVVTNRKAGMALEATSLRALEILREAGVPAMPLKGPALGKRLHGEFGLRYTADVDVLVPRSHLDRAVAALRENGFTRMGGPSDLHLVVGTGQPWTAPVELHWTVHWYEDAFSEELVTTSRVDAAGEFAPDPVLELASLLLFWVRDGLASLRYPADIAAWWDRFGDAATPDALAAVGERHPRIRSALRVPALLSQSIVGVPIGSAVRAGRALDRRERLACRLANWQLNGDVQQIAADTALIDVLVSPPGARAAAVRRSLDRAADAAQDPPTLGRRLVQTLKLAARCAMGLRRARALALAR